MGAIYYNTITDSFRLVSVYINQYMLIETSQSEYIYTIQDAIDTLSLDNYVLIGYL